MSDLIRLPNGDHVRADLIRCIRALDTRVYGTLVLPPSVLVHVDSGDGLVLDLPCTTFDEARAMRDAIAAQVAAANREIDPHAG